MKLFAGHKFAYSRLSLLSIEDKQAKAQLRAIDQQTALHMRPTLARYLETGEGDVKRLQNIEPPEFRLRVGDYRIRFHESQDTVRIICAF